MIRWVCNISLWVMLSGFFVAVFAVMVGNFDLTTAIEAGGLFLIGLIGTIWSWPRARALSKHNQ